MKKENTSSKKKLLISLMLFVSVLSLFFTRNNFNKEESKLIVNKVSIPNQINLTLDEQRIRLEYLVNAQTSKYECEENILNKELSSYGYKTHETGIDIKDNSKYGKDELVRYCRMDIDKPGYVVKDLISNTEQINTSKRMFQNDSLYEWYIQPRIRIDKEAIKQNPRLKICSIEIIDYEGNIIRKCDLTGINFMDLDKDIINNEYYNGEYIEQFFEINPDLNLTINGNELNPKHKKDKTRSKLDYRIYWWGECDMWLDYVKVENETANKLLKGNDAQFEKWIKAMDYNNIEYLKSYKCEFNQSEGINYIMNKLTEYSTKNIAVNK